MHRKNLLVYNCCNGQAIEAVCECLPELDVVSPLALVVESIDAVDGCTLMVPAQDEEIFGIFDFVCEQQAYSLQRLLSSIHVIAKE